jgi:hypothetical protein
VQAPVSATSLDGRRQSCLTGRWTVMSDSFSSQVSELRRTLQGAIIQLEATGSGRKLREQTRVALVARAAERIGDPLYWLHRRALERERLSGSHQDPDPSPALKDLLDEIREAAQGRITDRAGQAPRTQAQSGPALVTPGAADARPAPAAATTPPENADSKCGCSTRRWRGRP